MKRAILLSLLILAACSSWAWMSAQALHNEKAAAKQLAELGALIVMDGERKHVASISLSPLADDEARLERAIELLPHFQRVKSLDANRTQFGDEHAKVLLSLPNLRSLTLNNTNVSDAAIQYISRLDRLEALHLSDTHLSGGSLRSMANCSSLRVLDLSGTGVHGDLSPLAELPSLEWLVLRRLKLSNTSLHGLVNCPSLRRINVEGSEITKESVDDFVQRRPSLAISGRYLERASP